jgi:putative Mg2+ transporter-C (MgtC) family protein
MREALLHGFLGHLLVAAFCGALLGLERELRRKPTGLRTNMMIALGAAIFTYASTSLDVQRGDPARIAAQIVTGLGFIGAGSILRHGDDSVSGLTSAATVWVVGALGLLAGAGQHLHALAGTVLALVGLHYLERLELWIHARFAKYRLRVETEAVEGIQAGLATHLHELSVDVQPFQFEPAPEGRCKIMVEYFATRARQEQLLRKVTARPGVLTTESHQL